jgi:serine O-acetyltransferase
LRGNRFLFDIDEQAVSQEAILNRRADKRRSHGEESSGDSEYAYVVAELRQLRAASQLSRYRGAAPRLPSREAISELVGSLISALYPRHFGPPGLDARDVDAFVARTVAKALPALQHEIELALALEQEGARDPANANRRSATEITRLFAAALPKVRAALDKDVRAAFANDPSAKSIDEVIFCFPGVAAIMRHGLAHELYRFGAPLLARIVAEIAHALAGVDIHPGAEIKEGFFIDHGPGVVIGETAVIGRNVRIYQAVTLGAKRFEVGGDGELRKSYPRHPIVEDDVVIYAGATILGGITIGRGSSIGGNVWLTETVPPGSRITQAKTQANARGISI